MKHRIQNKHTTLATVKKAEKIRWEKKEKAYKLEKKQNDPPEKSIYSRNKQTKTY